MKAKLFLLIMIISLSFIIFGCNKEYSGLGTIQGSMIVSEDCQTNKCPIPDYTDIYASRKLVIYNTENNTPVAYLKISDNGTYSQKLPPGEYAIDLVNNHYDIIFDMPKNFKIEENKTNFVDVNIVIDRNDQPR